MERFMEPSGRNRSQPVANGAASKTAQIGETVAVGYAQLPRKCHGKEGVEFSPSPQHLAGDSARLATALSMKTRFRGPLVAQSSLGCWLDHAEAGRRAKSACK